MAVREQLPKAAAPETRRPEIERFPYAPDAERAVLAIVLVSGHVAPVENLEAADFWDLLYRYVFTELRLMWEAGEPLGDPLILRQWLEQPAARRRSREVMKASGEELAPEAIRYTVAQIGSEPAFTANLAHYLGRLRNYRLLRGLYRFSEWMRDAAAARPLEAIAVIDEGRALYDQLWAKANEALPDDFAKSTKKARTKR